MALGDHLTMPPLQLTFTPRRHLGSVLGWILLLVGMASAATFVWMGQTLLQQRQLLTSQVALLSAPPPAPATISSQAVAEAAQIGAVHARLQTSWQPVFNALEQSAPGKIALLSIQVTARSGSLEIEAQAPDLQEALDWVSRLQSQAALHHVLLQRNKTLIDAPGQPVLIRVHADLAT